MSVTKTVCMALAAAAFACAVVIAPASAQQPPQPSANAVALGKELITMKGGSTMFERVVPGVIESAKSSFVAGNPNLSKDLTDVAAGLKKELDAKRTEIVTQVATIYAQRFSEQELKDLVAFYKTPLGQKAIAEEPAAIDAAMKHAQVWAEDLYAQVQNRFRDEMKKKGHNL
jgi:uncharacterized protein